ncbi:MAG: 50S ribosomal protein L29 [Thermoleophilia bacterium]|nr:50S ribosomal protein L29 [Thermoleophilia bacterium]
MISLKANELRDLSDDELIERMGETRKQLFNLRFQHATGQLDNPRKLRLVRQDIARIMTVQGERERVAATTEGQEA